ncbi:MAG: hypothetical protein EAZ89_07780 [Bacteroidetes bacterium]|nr:MAG: hypothetical protein EAZ89_07780 [Bacteroidota bacterium]
MDMSEFTFSDFRLRFVYDDEGGWGWGMGVDNFRLLGRKGDCGDGKCETGELGGGCDADCRAAAPSPFWIPPGTNLEGASVAWRSFKGNTPCDDCSEEITLGFDFTFYGQTYKKAFLNSNGNLTFLADFIEYTPAPFCIESPGMIAPFFADADLQRGGKIEWYADPQHHYFIATWTAVGYFGCQGACALRNTFQVILTDGSIRYINGEIVPQGATILFVYGDMQWTAGSSSGGSAGLGGAPATVGVNLGDGALCMDHGAFDREGYIYYGNSQDEGCEPNAVSHLDHRCLFFNGETGQSIVPGTAVHVQLLSQPGGHQIIWQTERPDLVNTFRIERSQDSLAFLTLLEAPPGDLTQNPPGVFTHTDTRYPGGKVYYRILSQLKDGTLIYSETAEIESAIRPDDAYPSDTALNLKVGPNPFSEYIDVSFSLEKTASVRYLLTDMSGRAFASGDIDAVTGSNTFRIQTGSLPAAMFVITLFEGSRKAHRNLVKQ